MGERTRTWRDRVFARRGTLLAIPAVLLVSAGRPTPRGIALGVPVALAGEALRCWAVGYSGVTTRSDQVTAPALVTAGPYAFVRNPLYVGNALSALGFTIAFAAGRPAAGRAALALGGLGTMFAVYAAIVPLEEAYLRATFGTEFEAYVAAVPRVVPRVPPLPEPAGAYDASVIARAESRTFVWFGVMLAALALRARGMRRSE